MPKETRELFQEMHRECTRDGDIVRLQANEERIFECLDKMEKGQEKVAAALEKLASQGEVIAYDRAENAKRFENLFKRVSDLEKAPGKFWHAVASSIIAAVLTAAFLYALRLKP